MSERSYFDRSPKLPFPMVASSFSKNSCPWVLLRVCSLENADLIVTWGRFLWWKCLYKETVQVWIFQLLSWSVFAKTLNNGGAEDFVVGNIGWCWEHSVEYYILCTKVSYQYNLCCPNRSWLRILQSNKSYYAARYRAAVRSVNRVEIASSPASTVSPRLTGFATTRENSFDFSFA